MGPDGKRFDRLRFHDCPVLWAPADDGRRGSGGATASAPVSWSGVNRVGGTRTAGFVLAVPLGHQIPLETAIPVSCRIARRRNANAAPAGRVGCRSYRNLRVWSCAYGCALTAFTKQQPVDPQSEVTMANKFKLNTLIIRGDNIGT